MKENYFQILEECTQDDVEFILHCLVEAVKRCTTDVVCEKIQIEHLKIIDEEYEEYFENLDS